MSLFHIVSLLLAALLFILWFLLGTHTKTDNVSVHKPARMVAWREPGTR
jgi:hypothetical protein